MKRCKMNTDRMKVKMVSLEMESIVELHLADFATKWPFSLREMRLDSV